MTISLLLVACHGDFGAGKGLSGAGTSAPINAVRTASSSEPPAALLPQEPPPLGAFEEFRTDFTLHSVPYNEILSGGVPKDGIPAISYPEFISVSEADSWLKPAEPVIFVQVGQQARAYPIQILIWHEIVNDTIGEMPLLVTFCPLCNTAIAFERTLDGKIYDFGTTGRLRYSNLIMYDRQTETWWQQASGEAIAGELTGSRLNLYPAAIISWENFKSAYPDGSVLSRATGFRRPYGENPYLGYDDVNRPPFLYQGPDIPGQLPPMARVLAIVLDGQALAYPYPVLEQIRVVNDTVGGMAIAVFWAPGAASALDASSVATGRAVGSAAAYSRCLAGRTLTFVFQSNHILDRETESEWDIFGRAISGELAGAQLTPVVAVNHFWFSWAAFRPETKIYQP